MGILEPTNQTPPVQYKETLLFGASHKPQCGKSSMASCAPTPLVGHHSHKLQCELTSDICPYSGAGYLESATAHGNCLLLRTEFNRSLCLQFHPQFHPSPRPLDRESGNKMQNLPAQQKEEVPGDSAQKLHMRIQRHGPRRYPNIIGHHGQSGLV